MIGNGDEVDDLMKHTHETSILKARSFVIFQWLTVLKKTNPLYADVDDINTNFENIENLSIDLMKKH